MKRVVDFLLKHHLVNKASDIVSLIQYRFTLGIQFITFVNFTLLIITASDKLKTLIPLSLPVLMILMIPCGLIGMILFGTFLDVIIKYPQRQATLGNKRNPIYDDLFSQLNRIEQKIDMQKEAIQKTSQKEG
jgi:hypothetical protein